MNELNKLYEAMLLSWGALIKDEGRIVFMIDGQEFPIKIDNMSLHLPLSEVLDGNCVEKVFFHPACENITSKETEVFKIVRKLTCMRLLDTFRKVPLVLFTVAGQKAKSTWSQKTLDMLEPLKGTKRAVRDELNQLFARMHIEVEDNGLDNRFIHFKVSKGGGRSKGGHGEKVYYKTKPTFPFYNEIVKRLARSEGSSDNQTVELNNHTVSRGALKLAAHLFQSILPAVIQPDDYEFDSHTPVAARLISYLGCYEGIAEQLNKIQNTFRGEFDKVGVYTIDLDWTEHLEELPEIYRQVPAMDYNTHNTYDETTDHANNRTDFGGLLSVSSTQHQPQQHQQQQQMQQSGNLIGDFDVSAPQMQNGDRYVRYEIDYLNNRVLHYAVNIQGMQVVYICSKKANLLGRQDGGMMMQGGNMMMGNNMGGQMMPNGMIMLPNGMYMMPNQQMGNMPTQMPTHSASVYNDGGGWGGGGLNDAQSW